MSATYDVAIVGASGMVGTNVLAILAQRNFPVGNIYLLASHRSAGEQREFKGKTYNITDIADFDFAKTQFCFFCTGNDIAAKYAPIAVAKGNIVLDKSSHFRNHASVPLLVPEVNQQSLSQYAEPNLIASPNCNTIPIVVALKPLYDAVGISRITIATYQSVSGSGKEAISELTEQTNRVLNGESVAPKVYPHQIAFNVLPHIDSFEANGYTREEMKMVWEIQKIFNDNTIAINPTAVRVPVYCGHSAAVHIETNAPLAVSEATRLLQAAPSVKVIEGEYPYPTPALEGTGQDYVYVGRIRADLSQPNGLNLWIVADNLRKGAALNSIQIAENIIKSWALENV